MILPAIKATQKLDVLIQGYLLLCLAADAGKSDEVDTLLSQGVDVNAYGLVHGSEWWGSEVNAMLDVLQTAVISSIHMAYSHACSV